MTILQRFAANSVPHKTMNLLELKEKIRAILEDWTKESPSLSPKSLHFLLTGPLFFGHVKADEIVDAPEDKKDSE